jgi:hypothetical protein
MQDNSAKNGQFLKLELEILEGDQAGRKLFDRLNLDNQNAQAVEIAQRTLSAICHATGKLAIADSEELHGVPLIAVVKVDPGRTHNGKEYGPSNSIKTYKAIGSGAANAASSATSSAFKPAANSAGAAKASPWKRAANG